jgi:hypothetical protein
MRRHEKEAVHDVETRCVTGRNITTGWSSRFLPVTALAAAGSAPGRLRRPRLTACVRREYGTCTRGQRLDIRRVWDPRKAWSNEAKHGLSFRGGVRGKYVAEVTKGTNLTLLAPDLFPDATSVNDALRAIGVITRRHGGARPRKARIQEIVAPASRRRSV